MVNVLDKDQVRMAAQYLGCEPAALWAVAQVESSGNGFLPSGKVRILFEGHIFFGLLRNKYGQNMAYQTSERYPNVCYSVWDRSKYVGGEGEYTRLGTAMKIDPDLAMQSASWGTFQLMGFNYRAAGYTTVLAMVVSMRTSENDQLEATTRWLKVNGLDKLLAAKNWTAFARAYNGPGYQLNKYDIKLLEAYNRAKGDWM